MSNIKKNFSYQIIYRIITVVTPLVTAPILSRALGAENLGVFSATQAYVNYFLLFAMLGVENYGNRSIAAVQNIRDKRQKLFWNIYFVQFTASTISIIVYVITILFLPEGRKLIALLQGIWLLSTLFDINWFFFGCEQFKLTVTRNIIVKIITVICIIIFIRKPNDLALYIVIMAGSMALSQLILWGSLRKFVSFEKPCINEIKPHIKPILVLFVPVLALSVFHIMDKSMLDLLSNEANVGYYYSADKIINIPLGIITAVGTVMLPRIANILHNESIEHAKPLLKKSSELVVFLTASVGFGIAAIAKEFVPVFFGPGYESCVFLIYLFVPVLFVKAWSSLIRSQYLIPAKKDKLYISAVFCGAAANLISNYFLIIRYGAAGAVMGTLIAEAVVLIVQLVFVNKEIDFLRYYISQFLYISFGIIMFIGVRLIAKHIIMNDILKIAVLIVCGGTIYLGLSALLWSIKKDSIFRIYISSKCLFKGGKYPPKE